MRSDLRSTSGPILAHGVTFRTSRSAPIAVRVNNPRDLARLRESSGAAFVLAFLRSIGAAYASACWSELARLLGPHPPSAGEVLRSPEVLREVLHETHLAPKWRLLFDLPHEIGPVTLPPCTRKQNK